MTQPTKAQMDQAVQNAASVLADALNISIVDVLENHSEQVFHLVCAYAATEAA